MERLNDLIIDQILLRTPASSLIRYRLMCKTWRDIIKKPEFKKEHAELHNKTYEPLRLLEFKMGVQMLPKGVVVDVDRKPVYDIWMPQDLGSDGHFGGSLNGLICTEVKGEITVFNPITRQMRPLPKPTHIIPGYGSNQYEWMRADFLFHSATSEYKVVLFHQYNFTLPNCSVNMYTLGANSSWRRVCLLSGFPRNHGINFEDTIYWHCLSETRGTDIVSLDLSTENIKYIHSPEDAMLTGLTKWHDGKLCGLSFQQEHATMHLWTLNSNSVEAGILIYTMRYTCQLERNLVPWLLAPYSIKNNIVYYVNSENNLVCHDISTNVAMKNPRGGSTTVELMHSFAYVETLLPVLPA